LIPVAVIYAGGQLGKVLLKGKNKHLTIVQYLNGEDDAILEKNPNHLAI
jgi:hypothetical protein